MCQGWGAGMVRSRSLIRLHWVIFPVLLPCCFSTHKSHQSAFALVVGSITCTAGRAVWANPVLATPAPCTVLGGLGCSFSTSSCKPSIRETKKYPNPTQSCQKCHSMGLKAQPSAAAAIPPAFLCQQSNTPPKTLRNISL